MPASHGSVPRRRRSPSSRRLGWLGAVAVGLWLASVFAPHAQGVDSGRDNAESARHNPFSLERFPVPDDTVLQKQLDETITLRERERFDRVLDAREPGELVEHATVTEQVFERRPIGIDALRVVGDELFGYPFRPENGWGRGGADRHALGYTPELRRVHLGTSGGPDAFGCFGCHSKGGPDGAGTQTQNAFFRGDGATISSADQRNAPHVLGLGPVALLAREMSAELHAEAAGAVARAQAAGRPVKQNLTTKGVSFGSITVAADGTLDASAVVGVDPDLTIRPFGWKGHQATLRDIAEESLHLHQGLLSNRIQFGVRDGTIDPAPYGKGPWYDVDEDGVSLEIDSGMLTTVVGYLAQLEVPVVRPPREPDLLDAWAQGRARFDAIGCARCHVPTLELQDTKLDAREPAPPGHRELVIDVAKDGDEPRIEPKYAGEATPYLVHLFSDLKRHDMGASLATAAPQGTIPASVFLTRPLWGLAETAPYLHDGRAPTLHEAIALHDGEARAARDAYLALDESARGSVRVFLASLSRTPKLFVP